ncbi:MAG: hypothetical protein ACUVR2_02710 [Anaerolineae bacterium]
MTHELARKITAKRYAALEALRLRNVKSLRRTRADRQAEKKERGKGVPTRSQRRA